MHCIALLAEVLTTASMERGYFDATDEPSPGANEPSRGWNPAGNRWTDLGEDTALGDSYHYDQCDTDGRVFLSQRGGHC